MPHNLRIIFMGTPDFAVPSLQALAEAGYQVVAVVTAPDKPSGRGLQLKASPVKIYAQSQGIPVLQPEKLKNPEFLSALRAFQADLQVVVAFRMLPEVVWNMPPKGTINLHASLLPDYRGAAPINHAIIQGETETGATTFFLQHAIDTGDIIDSIRVPILPDDNAGTLHDKLMIQGAQLIVKTVDAIEQNTYTTQAQSGVSDKTAPKIFRDDCKIDWHQPAIRIHNLIRGLSPYPAAFTDVAGIQWKIFQSTPVITTHQLQPGTLVSDHKTYLHIACADGFLNIISLQAEGKKRMEIAEFLRGNRIPQ